MLTIKVEHLQRGQPTNYAPHIYRSLIIVEGDQPWDRLLEGQVRELARVVVHHFTDDPVDGSMASYYRPRLTELRLVEKPTASARDDECDEWLVEIQEPYCD